MNTGRTDMELLCSDSQRKVTRAAVLLCIVFFACAILVLTSFAPNAFAAEDTYNSETISSAGSDGVVVMAPAATPESVAAPAQQVASCAATPVALTASVPTEAAPAPSMSVPEVTPFAADFGSAPEAANPAVASTPDSPASVTQAVNEQVLHTINFWVITDTGRQQIRGSEQMSALPDAADETFAIPIDGYTMKTVTKTATDGSVVVDVVYEPVVDETAALYGPILLPTATEPLQAAANTGMSTYASNSGFFSSNTNISWSVNTTTMTLNIRPVQANGNMVVTEFASSLPWKSSFTTTDIFQVVIEGAVAPTNLQNWFGGYTSLVSFQAPNLDTSRVSNFSNMFNGCTSLEQVIGIGSWNTSSGTNFVGMFTGCSNLKELDFSNWTIGTVNKTGMLSNIGSIEKVTLNPGVILDGTGFGNTASRGPNAGTWKSDSGFSGTTSDLVSLYGSSSRPAGAIAYVFHYESSFPSNSTVLWSYDGSTNTLTIDGTGSTNTIVSDLAEDLPWLPSVGAAAIKAVVTKGGVKPTNLTSWFANYANLVSFNGTGLDVTQVTSFADLFRGNTFLSSVDLSGWDMEAVKDAPRARMFDNCTALTTLTVTQRVILSDTGLSDTLARRLPIMGTWDCSDGVWFGTTGNLATRYAASKRPEARPSSTTAAALTYTWHPNQIGGRFQNDNVWWRFSGTTDGILTLGADSVDCHGNPIDEYDKQVTESAEKVPWLTSGAIATGSFAIRSVVTRNGIAPTTLENWFKGYLQLLTFDGSGMDVSAVGGSGNFNGLFAESSVNTVNLTGWKMSASATRTNMFDKTASLRRLTLSGDVILYGTGIATLVDHDTSNGSWSTEDSAWFGSSENLAARYPVSPTTPGDAVGTFTYIWDPSMRSGRFEGNDSVYWIYTNGTITIGADAGATNTIVTQDATNLPWNGIINKSQITSIIFRATGDESNPTKVKPVNFGGSDAQPLGWFADYTAMVSFSGAGVDLTNTNSLKNLFLNCNALNSISGVVNWNTSGITTLEGLFDGCNLMTVQPTINSWDTSHVTNFSYMFRNTKDLVTVDAIANWDVTAAQTFKGMFEGANFIVTLDISGWNMPSGADRTNMFAFFEAIASLKVSQSTILTGTGLDDAELVKTRIDSMGSWDCSDGIWFGSTRNLTARYAGNSIVPGTLTYTWSSNNLRGRFDSNDNAWWKFDQTAGGLTLGTDQYKGTGPNPDPAVVNRTVTEAANQVPWLRAIGEMYSVIVNMVTIADGDGFNPINLTSWFRNYHQLTSFNGAGLDLDGTPRLPTSSVATSASTP